MKKKIVFLTCTWYRTEVTKIFISCLLETQKKVSDLFDFVNIVIDSDNSNYELFKENTDFIYHNYENFPVSNKWNYGASICKNIDFDYIFMLGSDDIINDKLLRKYYDYFKLDYDYIGILDMYAFDAKKK